jgi:hypothetical protein
MLTDAGKIMSDTKVLSQVDEDEEIQPPSCSS